MNKNVIYLFIFLLCLEITASAQICATPGADGTTNITGSINTYYPAVDNTTLASGTKSVILNAVPPTDVYSNTFGSMPINAGDLLLIIQMQDATINFTNSTLYGSNNATAGPDGLGATGFTDIGNSGKYEYVIATNNVPLTGGSLTFKGLGTSNGAVNTYVNAVPTAIRGKKSFQVIRIPQYSNLRLSSSISPPPFNGGAGGIIAFQVAGNMDFNGFAIDVSARGFRGGYSLIKQSVANISDLYVTVSTDARASGKGEGTAGTPRYMWDGYNAIDNEIEGLPGGSDGRGAPANAGGGGNDSNAGGGGGGNGGSGGVGGWGYEPEGGTNPAGGRPGSVNNTGTPDNTRLFMGGGGGGGHANDALTGVKGGVGGGIVLVNAASITGNGTILANGGNGAPGAYGGHPDGSGGGGAGGTVLINLSMPTASTLTVQAMGGLGGNTENDPGSPGVQPHGPGGGGGGGQIFYTAALVTINTDVSAGKSGKTNSGNGITHNAADGKPGMVSSYTAAALPAYLNAQASTCYPQLVTDMSVIGPAATRAPGDVVTYIINITNTASGGNAGGVEADIQLPAGLNFVSATAIYTGAANSTTAITNYGSANEPIVGDFNIPAGDKVTINLITSIECYAVHGVYSSSAEAIYLDPTRTYLNPNRRITAAINAFSTANITYETSDAGPVPGSNYNGASSTAEDITISSNNGYTISPDGSICSGGSYMLNASGGTLYQWSPAAGLSQTDIANPTASPSTTTTYTVSITNGSCIANLSTTVTVFQPPIVNAGKDLQIAGGQSVKLNASSIGGDNVVGYQWSPTTYLDNPNILNPTAIPLKNINYRLTVTYGNGCTISDTLAIKIYNNIIVPNTFTPNFDGVNDTWNISALVNYPTCLVNVYNRYGTPIFKSIGYPKAWDGKYDSKPVPAGTYYYTIDLKDGSKIISGWVVVVR